MRIGKKYYDAKKSEAKQDDDDVFGNVAKAAVKKGVDGLIIYEHHGFTIQRLETEADRLIKRFPSIEEVLIYRNAKKNRQ